MTLDEQRQLEARPVTGGEFIRTMIGLALGFCGLVVLFVALCYMVVIIRQ